MENIKATNSQLDLRLVLESLVEKPSNTSQLSEMSLGPPPGNFLASEIRQIQDDSHSVFPESVYSNVITARNRWKSQYHSEFVPKNESGYNDYMSAPTAPPGLGQRRRSDLGGSLNDLDKPFSAPVFSMKRPASEHLKTHETDKMFNSWKVPARITDEPAHSRTGSALYDPDVSTLRRSKSKIDQFPSLKTHHVTQSTDVPPTPRSSRRTPLPTSYNMPVIDRRTPLQHIENRKTNTLNQAKSFRTKQLLNFYQTEPKGIEEFIQNGSEKEKDLVEQTLKMIYTQKTKDDAITNVQKWIETASKKERHVALNFFESIGIKMLGNCSDQEQEAVAKILTMLKMSQFERNNNLSLHRSNTMGDIKPSGPRYVRLLTPTTRANKWMHQTWHHLPNYRDDNPVYNKSAMYSNPGAHAYRHWNIHPDWELQQRI